MRKITPEQENYMESTAMVGNPKKAKTPPKVYPHMKLEHKFFPEAKKCEVGKMCKFMIEAKITGLSISKFQNDTELEIHGFEMMDMNKGKGMDNMDEEKE